MVDIRVENFFSLALDGNWISKILLFSIPIGRFKKWADLEYAY